MMNPINANQQNSVMVIANRYRLLTWRLGVALALTMPMVLLSGCPEDMNSDPGAPTLSGCPTQDMAMGDTVTLMITVEEGTILGVAKGAASVIIRGPNDSNFVVDDVVLTRVDDQTFMAVITLNDLGEITMQFFVAKDDVSVEETELKCTFMVVTPLGACCESFSCEVTEENECFFRDGIFNGPGSLCTDAKVDCGVCEIDENCPDDDDVCTLRFCALGVCSQRPRCAGCDPMTGNCPITIDVPFPTTIENGDSVDLTINWSTQVETNLAKTATFGSAVGQCPDGFSCPSATLTRENPSPFFIPNVFTCRIDGETEPVPFLYEVNLSDNEGLSSNIVRLVFNCVPLDN